MPKLLVAIYTFLVVLLFFPAFAQTQVTGKVTDREGEPLPGATVLINGTTNGTVTDLDGNFILTASPNADTLKVSFVGYQTVALPIEETMDINLSEDYGQLEEVVVVGYGALDRSDVVGAVSSVEVEEATTIPTTNVAEMLRGRAPGVQVNLNDPRPGGDSEIVIRGKVSLVGNNPLIIVDGVPYDNLNDVAPENITSVEVLKDASSQAIYGARAANGVILITTKRGKEGKFQVNYHGYVTGQRLTKNFDLYSGAEFAQLRREANRTDNDDEYLDDATIFEPFELEAIEDQNYVDWEDLVMEDAILTSHAVNVSGGSEQTQFFTSLTYFNQDGLIPTSGFERGTFRLNLDHKFSDKFSLQMNLNLQTSTQNIESNSLNFITISPLAKPFDENGELIREPLGDGRLTVNPLWNIRESDNEVKTNLRDLTLVGQYNFTPNLSYKLNAFSRTRDGRQGIYRSTQHSRGDGDIRGLATLGNRNYEEFLIENIVDYGPDLSENHRLNFTFVHAVNQRKNIETSLTKSGFANDNLSFNGKADLIRGTSRDVSRRRLVSFLGRVRYSLLDKYLLTLTARADGSSVFAENEKFGFFPAAALAWKVHEEEFLRGSPFNQLKFRVSYGATGNEGINPSESLGLAADLPYVFGGTTVGGFAPLNRLPNPNLKWETTTTFNAGMDFIVFDNLLNGSVEYYHASTTDFLLDRLLSGISGFSVTRFNIGEVQNYGLEVGLNANIVQTQDWQWTAGINWSTNDNEVISLAGERDQEGELIDFASQGLFIGEPIDNIHQFIFDGIYQEGDDIENSGRPDARPGDIRVVDRNDDGEITDEDRIVISENPDWYGSFTTTLRFKGFELFADIYLLQGATRVNPYLADNDKGATLQGRLNGIKVDYYLPEDPSNEYPRPKTSTPSFLRSLAVDDASYQRLRTITLGYNFSEGMLSSVGLRSARVYVTGTNLITLTDFKSYSPELNPGAFPDAKAITAGVQIGI